VSDLTIRDIAYSDLKQKRAETIVEVSPGGTLDDYVPFYFGPRSPMLFVYKSGGVTGKPEDQNELVYFGTYAEDIADKELPFVFTDGHPIREPKAFYNEISDLSHVDHPLMQEVMWRDTNDDPDKKRRRQAEFLVHDRVELSLVRCLGTRTSHMQSEVQEILRRNSIDIPCLLKPEWYYN
jgi:hypothetical protein